MGNILTPSNLIRTIIMLLITAGSLPAQLSIDIDEERLSRFVSDLSAPEMKGRLTGTEAGKLSEEYVEQKMRALGIETVVQIVRFPLYEVLQPTSFSHIDADAECHAFEYIKDYREVDFTGSGIVEADLVFADYGIDTLDYNSYEQVDVLGKIGVVLTGIPAHFPREAEYARIDKKVDQAYRNGAVGMILIPTGGMAQAVKQKTDEAKMWALDLKWKLHKELTHEDFPVVFLQEHAVTRLTGRTTEELTTQPDSVKIDGRVRLELHSQIHENAVSKNIIGIIPGTDPLLKDEVILIGAHYDHLGLGADGRIFYGAADNASGTAVVLEAAHVFAESGQKPKRTVVFALWCGEEQGHFGSKHYVDTEPLFPIPETKLMIQVDYLGNQYGPCITNLDDKEIIQDFIGKNVEEEKLIPVDWQGKCASDDCAFLAVGVPAYRFIAYGDHHHRSSDTYENLNKEILLSTTRIIVDGIRNLAY